MAVAKTRGNLSIRLRPDSPEWHFETQRTTCTLVYEGLYNDLLSSKPPIGGTIQGYGNQLLVEDVAIKKVVSGKTTMTVLLMQEVDPPPNVIPAVQPVYEFEWTQLERPIEQAPPFKTLFPDPTGQTQFSADQITALGKFTDWENATDSSSKQTAYNALSDDFKKLAQKKMRGETTILMFAPVARITSQARNVSAVDPCGKVFSTIPDFDQLPDGYSWLQTADRSTRTGIKGKWQRVQEWTGADRWDKDLYPPTDG